MSKKENITASFGNKSRILLALLAMIMTPFFSGCGTSQQAGYLVNLEIWGIFDDSTVYNEIINQYKTINPYVGEIKYRKFSPDTYSQELLDALASGQGPDIFLINNSWLPSYVNKLEPAPTPFVSEQDVKNNFPDVVLSDFVENSKVYAVPLSIDSMALYYNKDMFNAAGITSPPKTWLEFNSAVKKLTVIDAVGNIRQSGAAIGTAYNVNRASDILSLLMLQNGVELPMKKGMLAKFDEGVVSPEGEIIQAGEMALGYYTQFSRLSTATNTQNPLYTWNGRQHNSVDAFAEGSVAMLFNYSWQNDEIRSKNPKLNYEISTVPQIYPAKPVSVANYWGYGVARNKVNPVAAVGAQSSAPVPNEVRTHESWQFLRFLTLKNAGMITLYNASTKNSKDFPINFDPALDYLKKTQQPAARRDLIEAQKTDSKLGPFAQSNLVAKHWYQVDPINVDNILSDVIESVARGDLSLHDGLVLAKNRVNYSSGGSTAR
ncbi:MAG: hypothetical protein ACD_56C00037G0006 [uncultured bacterium]|nr:MAG: hypothetical protein ACD_56C00037G0006 [uncultured bacterium]